ncbi:hypothetical protein [Acinetobacter wuhouensis]|uniref:Uncharacterized protein n=1 Tax=Acinetobacter wuhouensis TaxID=1879050 RepID=A0A4Q7AIH3_9GAMM|nr:hypothetical protein [Acinetobacter wuhouensis]RZG48050.1 hypothetical protein EXU28_04585 [Acinetobacter wuhouensis]
MENLLKIGGVLAVLVVPIILAFLNNRLAHLKHSQDSKTEALKLASEFEHSELEKRSILYKDRMAKSLFNNDLLTYNEAKFFLQYENADLWVREYVKVKVMLKRERNDDGVVTGFKRKSHVIFAILNFIGYSILFSIGLIPFVIMNKYLELMVNFYDKGMPLVVIMMIVIPIMFLIIGYLCLRYTERYATCSIFLHDFNKFAFKITPSDKSGIDVEAKIVNDKFSLKTWSEWKF